MPNLNNAGWIAHYLGTQFSWYRVLFLFHFLFVYFATQFINWFYQLLYTNMHTCMCGYSTESHVEFISEIQQTLLSNETYTIVKHYLLDY